LKKRLYQFFIPYSKQKNILFIVGCQRSGTTLLIRIFENDLNTNVYNEFSKLSGKYSTGKLRLNPLHIVEKDIKKDRAPFTILKPLVESQNTLELLNHFKNGKALWVYRNYKDVAASDLKQFGLKNGIRNLRPIVNNNKDNWRSEKVSVEERKIILRYFSEDMNPYDAAVLFWYLRNNLFFRLGLDKNPRILLCKYQYLVKFPGRVIRDIYQKSKQKFPREKIYKEIHTNSIKKGKKIPISPEIEKLAQGLQNRLDIVFYDKNPSFKKV
jgi:hypothetical protein